MESMFVERAPLRRHIDADDVGGAAAYLLSDDAKNVTGTTLYVDAGYHRWACRDVPLLSRFWLGHALSWSCTSSMRVLVMTR